VAESKRTIGTVWVEMCGMEHGCKRQMPVGQTDVKIQISLMVVTYQAWCASCIYLFLFNDVSQMMQKGGSDNKFHLGMDH
jgi:hypothetical protein